MNMLRAILVTLAFSFIAAQSSQAIGQEWIVYSYRVKLSQVGGVVLDPAGEPLPGVLVEVYEKGDVLLKSGHKNDARRRLVFSTDGNDGRFAFPGLKPGKYELRFTKSGFDTLSLIVSVVAPHDHGWKLLIRVQMKVAT